MGEAFVLDTSAVIKYLNESFPEKGYDFVDKEFTNGNTLLSVISRIELLAWKPTNAEEINVYEDFIACSEIIPITEAIILKTIEVRRDYKLKLPDAIIASTALVLNRTLLADNDLDFLRIPNLKYINPRTLS
jgi:predicted nucleic acid-binding protein